MPILAQKTLGKTINIFIIYFPFWLTSLLSPREVPLLQLQFKVLILLSAGENHFVLDFLGVKDELLLCYTPRYMLKPPTSFLC